MENAFNFLIYGIVAIVIIIIGINQCRSKTPVGFLGSEEPPSEKELTDVSAYNKAHGKMWMLYGIAVGAAGCIGILSGNKWVMTILIFLSIGGGIGIMNIKHAKIKEKYTNNKKGK